MFNELTLVSLSLTFVVRKTRVNFWPYPQTLDQAGKRMSVTDALAYYESSQITDRKSFITLGPENSPTSFMKTTPINCLHCCSGVGVNNESTVYLFYSIFLGISQYLYETSIFQKIIENQETLQKSLTRLKTIISFNYI